MIPKSLFCTITVLALGASRTAAFADPVNDAVALRCALDPRLGETAQATLAHHTPLQTATLRNIAEHSGVFAPSLRAWVGRGPESAVAASAGAWLSQQGTHASWSHCALARHGDVVALVLVPRLAQVHGVRPSVQQGARERYEVTLPNGARSAVIITMNPDGGIHQIPAEAPVEIAFERQGRYVLQVLARTPNGPLPFATWHVVAGDDRPTVAPTSAQTSAPNEPRRILAEINRSRLRAGAPSLRPDPMLGSLATDRATLLATLATVAHSLDPSDSPAARLAAAHIGADQIAENVARANSLAEANSRLDASPSHHANRMDPTLDAVGIGVATVGRTVYVVELFAAHPRIVADPTLVQP